MKAPRSPERQKMYIGTYLWVEQCKKRLHGVQFLLAIHDALELLVMGDVISLAYVFFFHLRQWICGRLGRQAVGRLGRQLAMDFTRKTRYRHDVPLERLGGRQFRSTRRCCRLGGIFVVRCNVEVDTRLFRHGFGLVNEMFPKWSIKLCTAHFLWCLSMKTFWSENRFCTQSCFQTQIQGKGVFLVLVLFLIPKSSAQSNFGCQVCTTTITPNRQLSKYFKAINRMIQEWRIL